MSLTSVQILVVDLGSQYTLVIGRTLRELGVRSAVLSPAQSVPWLESNRPKGIILSRGPNSVYERGAPEPPKRILSLGIPILGICYGMQWLAKVFGGEVVGDHTRSEYGPATISLDPNATLFNTIAPAQSVWASHGDRVASLPDGFEAVGWCAPDKSIAAFHNAQRGIWGLQFHPEVRNTEYGKDMLRQFLVAVCHCDFDWQPHDIITGIQTETAERIKNDRAIIGFSGGVDSTTLTAILRPVLGERLQAVTIDTGALRANELEEVRSYASIVGVQHHVLNRSRTFARSIPKTIDAEKKRHRFRDAYRKSLNGAGREFHAPWLLQGTLATDVIESGRAGASALIKSHHNVGLTFRLKQLHPLSHLFKYEVRELGASLKLPDSIARREPFPGPGLYIRVIGIPATPERIEIARWADEVVRKILLDAEPPEVFSQLVVALDGNRFVGVKGDKRVYGHAILVRAVETADFMTAIGHQFHRNTRQLITTALTKHPQIVHVGFFETPKPPATTEFE